MSRLEVMVEELSPDKAGRETMKLIFAAVPGCIMLLPDILMADSGSCRPIPPVGCAFLRWFVQEWYLAVERSRHSVTAWLF